MRTRGGATYTVGNKVGLVLGFADTLTGALVDEGIAEGLKLGLADGFTDGEAVGTMDGLSVGT